MWGCIPSFGGGRCVPGSYVKVDVAMAVATDCLLDGYRPSEIRALMEHKYYLGIERGYDPPLEEVIASWECFYAGDWRNRKMRRDAEVQVREIEAYREKMIAERGGPVTFREAAKAWIEQCECGWREAWEASRHSSV